jgi:hypothetical protein
VPINESAVGNPPLGAATLIGQLMDLHASPLPGSNKREEFFYDPTVDIVQEDLPAACAFFLQNGHIIDVINCPDIATFQTAYNHRLCPLSDLPLALIVKGHEMLQEMARVATGANNKAALAAAADATSAFPSVAKPSLVDRYINMASQSFHQVDGPPLVTEVSRLEMYHTNILLACLTKVRR